MSHRHRTRLACLLISLLPGSPSFASDMINGRVLAAGRPVVGSTVTLWAESIGTPRQLAQAQTGPDGRFTLTGEGNGAILYIVAKRGRTGDSQAVDNPAIGLMSVLGTTVPPSIINEMTTVAAVWTHAQFLDGTSIKGNPLGLKIAAGNLPHFVDLQTGGWGGAIQGLSTVVKRPRRPNNTAIVVDPKLTLSVNTSVTGVRSERCPATKMTRR